MDKRFTFSSIADDGEPLVIPVTADLTKQAGSVLPELVEFLRTLPEPAENMIRTVITALSAFEGFGPNRNGDAWLEDHLLRENTYPGKDGKEVVVPMYQSFEHFARPYKHHINRPDSPAYGNVVKSFYNPGMKRVELVVEWDKEKAPDICERLVNYEPVSTSIGFRCMPVDVCSVCGNPARTRREYCSHLKHEMLHVKPDGRIVCAINPKGMFFDISMVDDPADRTSRAVEASRITEPPKYQVIDEPVKVASATWHPDGWMSSQFVALADMATKLAEFEPYNPGGTKQKIKEDAKGGVVKESKPVIKKQGAKRADIVKRIQAEVELGPKEVETVSRGAQAVCPPKMDKSALRMLAQYPLKEAMVTASVLGIDLYPEEAQFIGLYPEHPKLAERLYDANLLVVADKAEEWDMGDVPASLELAEKLASSGMIAQRSMWQPWRVDQMVKSAYFGSDNPYLMPTPVPADQLSSIVPQQGLSTAQKMGLIASILIGAKLFLNNDEDSPIKMPGTPTQRTIALLGLAGLAGFLTGRKEGKEVTRMPIMDMRMQRAQMTPAQFGFRQAMSAPLAYNMLFGKTAGVLSSALGHDEGAMAIAASRLNAMKPFLRTEYRVKLGSLDASELVEFYDEPMLDAMIVSRAAGSY